MVRKTQGVLNERLKQERLLRGWSQADVAGHIGTDGYTVNRWERGRAMPSPYFRQKLCDLFSKNAEELGFLKESSDPAEYCLPAIWNVPYRRNPFFTGRENILKHLHTLLKGSKTAVLTQSPVINGPGGIGKTQTALEYAYRYHDQYETVLWVQADSHTMLLSGFMKLAELLDLPQKNAQDQNRIVAAVKSWLKEHAKWLLLLDNVEDLEVVTDFLPSIYAGHVLLTSCRQSTGSMAQRVEIDMMDPEEGALLLLRRARYILPGEPLDAVPEADRIMAMELSQVMDGLPLALDQAGAYIDETGCGLAGYLKRYEVWRSKLLRMRGSSSDHPESVATTWSLTFEKIQQTNKIASELLQFCAFLHSDAIPEEIFSDGASALGPILQPLASDLLALDVAISELRKFSIVRRNPDTNMLSMHSLIQAMLKDGMNEETQHMWIERVVQSLNQAFPEVEYSTWERCQRYLPHALECARLIKQCNISSPHAARLLNQAGEYLQDRGQYTQAEQFYQQALDIREQVLGPEHPDLATSLDNLATIYEFQWKFEQAEPLYQRALVMLEHVLEPGKTDLAASLNNVALFYQKQAKFSQAEPLYQRAVEIFESALGPDHPDVASSLNNLGMLYLQQGRFERAELLLRRALTIREQALGLSHPLVATSLRNVALLYHEQGKYEQAESLHLRALSIREQALGPHHPLVAASLTNLAALYHDQGRYEKAEPLCQRALAIREQALGSEHPVVAETLQTMATLHLAQADYEQAELLFTRALAILEQAHEYAHLDLAQALSDIAELHRVQGKYEQAEQLSRRALTIREQLLGLHHPCVAQNLNTLAELYRVQEKYLEARLLYTQALTILGQTVGLEHPKAVTCLDGLASIYYILEKEPQTETVRPCEMP